MKDVNISPFIFIFSVQHSMNSRLSKSQLNFLHDTKKTHTTQQSFSMLKQVKHIFILYLNYVFSFKHVSYRALRISIWMLTWQLIFRWGSEIMNDIFSYGEIIKKTRSYSLRFVAINRLSKTGFNFGEE